MNFTKLTCIAVAAIGGLAAAPASMAAERVLSGASSFPVGHIFSVKFEKFVKVVNERGKGLLKIDYKGGAPAIGSPFTLGAKVQQGAFDIATITGPYYASVVPEAQALQLAEIPIQEQRKNGAFDYVNKVHMAKGIYYLGRTFNTVFHVYLKNPIKGPQLKGLHLRIAPHHRDFITSLGATAQRSNLAEIYTYMENGTIDGFAWPAQGFLPDWYKVTKYRVDPSFYTPAMHVLLNLKTWKSLSGKQKTLLNDLIVEFEATNAQEQRAGDAAAWKKMADKGVKVIEFKGADRDKWLTTAKVAAWKGIAKRSPKHGPALRKLLAK